MAEGNSKRLAKNTLFMYIRMFVLLLISLYTSRILLQQLGIEDFGIYNLVGSIIAMLSSLRGLFASSTQRFLNYEMGKGHTEKLPTIFNMSVVINMIISLIFVISVEVLGYWFFTYKINIDPSRLFAAVCVFHLSVAASVVTIMTTPFDAVIIANERMGFYAYISILEGFLKLAIIFLLIWSPGDKLIVYAVLHLCVLLLIRFINAVYCRKHFPESHYKKCWDKGLFKDMSSFAGWNFFGNLGFSLSNEGVNMILNVFGGPVVNAARGIAYQVRSALYLFLTNANKSIDPYSTKVYAHNDKSQFFKTMFFTSKALFSVYLCMAIPIFFNTGSILKLWLGEIPAYSVVFVDLILIMGLMKSFFTPIDTLFFSANKVNHYQMINITMSILTILLSWFVLMIGYPFYSVMIVGILVHMLSFSLYIFLAERECFLDKTAFFFQVVLRAFVGLLLVSIASVIIKLFAREFALSLFVNIPMMMIVSIVVSYFLIFNVGERITINALVRNVLKLQR